MITEGYVRTIFKGLENGDGASFFEHVADDVDCTVMGAHPLAGAYKSKTDFTPARSPSSARCSRMGPYPRHRGR